MATPQLQSFDNGHFATPSGTELIDIVAPSTGAIVARAPVSNAKDVDDALAAAKIAFPPWSGEYLPDWVIGIVLGSVRADHRVGDEERELLRSTQQRQLRPLGVPRRRGHSRSRDDRAADRFDRSGRDIRAGDHRSVVIDRGGGGDDGRGQ